MGIRIHRVLGYALTDLRLDSKKEKVIDKRINLNCDVLNDRENIGSIDDFISYVNANRAPKSQDSGVQFLEIQLKNQPETVAKELGLCVLQDTEFGMGNVICIIPPSEFTNWRRYDDIIDYMMSAHESPDGGIKDTIVTLDKGIWPWEGYINRSNGERVDISSYFVYNRLADGLSKGGYQVSEIPKVKGSLDKISKKMGFKSFRDAEKNLTPTITSEVIWLCRYLNLFNDENTAFTLKPVVYTYWG